MKNFLESDFLKIAVKNLGAELCSLKRKNPSIEYLWQADSAYWGRHAPVLFPIVGRLKEDRFLSNGQWFHLNQHGLARNMEFQLLRRTKTVLVFELSSSEATLQQYPFPFRLQIKYRLRGRKLSIQYRVDNPSDQPIFFSIGGHPAFNCPLFEGEERSDYQLVFQQKETAFTQRLTEGIRNGKQELIIDNQRVIKIKNNLFDKDALVFKGLNSDWIRLQKGQKKLFTFHFKGFPYLGIWSKNRPSPFVCIEPWFGVADHQNHNQKITEKEGIIKLEKEKVFACEYSIRIH